MVRQASSNISAHSEERSTFTCALNESRRRVASAPRAAPPGIAVELTLQPRPVYGDLLGIRSITVAAQKRIFGIVRVLRLALQSDRKNLPPREIVIRARAALAAEEVELAAVGRKTRSGLAGRIEGDPFFLAAFRGDHIDIRRAGVIGLRVGDPFAIRRPGDDSEGPILGRGDLRG